MRRKTVQIGAVSLLCVCLILIGVLLVLHKQKESTYSCYQIPVGGGKLRWGMSKEQIITVMGEPALMEDNKGYEDILTYNTVSGKIGACSEIILHIGSGVAAVEIQEAAPKGLSIIEMKIDKTTKEATIKKLSAIYGSLVEKTSQLESDLQKGAPDYFNKIYYSDKWRLDTLPEEEYGRLAAFYQKSRKDWPIEKETVLMRMGLSGVASGDAYTCNVMLDAYVLSCLESAKNEK